MRRPWAASAVLAGVLAGCSSGGGSSSAPSRATTATTATRPSTTTVVTVATTPIPNTTTTAPATATTIDVTTVPTTIATTTIPLAPTSTAAAATTSATSPVPPCDPALLQAAADKAFGLPSGATLSQPRCVGGWASALVTAPGQDKAFTVFRAGPAGWEGANLGTDQVCSGAGVPADLYPALNCGPWEG
jgi:hypothetical protein